MAIKKNYLVKKRNVLNQLRDNNMSLQELRFFSIYLAKINPVDINTRLVRFSLSDFQKIMNLQELNIPYLKNVTDSLLCKILHAPNENGGYTAFQLFKECTVDIDEYGEWYIEIDAHDKALPYLFQYKNKYFSYQLWNALSLKSSNQLRLYEILKQYEKIGSYIISVDELKKLMGIKENDNMRYNNFRLQVLEVCRKSLEENTDIKFTYEPYGKKGRGGKILNLKFIISKNDKYVDQILLDDFINQPLEATEPIEDEQEDKYTKRMCFLSGACNDEFSEKEMQIIYDLLLANVPKNIFYDDISLYDYLKRKYDELQWRSEKSDIKYRFGYFKKLLEADIF